MSMLEIWHGNMGMKIAAHSILTGSFKDLEATLDDVTALELIAHRLFAVEQSGRCIEDRARKYGGFKSALMFSPVTKDENKPAKKPAKAKADPKSSGKDGKDAKSNPAKTSKKQPAAKTGK